MSGEIKQVVLYAIGTLLALYLAKKTFVGKYVN